MALILVMGIPGSGKTTLCTKLQKNLLQCTVFSFDDIFNDDGFMEYLWTPEHGYKSLLRLYGTEESTSAHRERKRCEEKVRNFLENVNADRIIGRTAGDNNERLIIVDDIFYLKSMRRPFKKMARLFKLAYIVILVNTPLDVALKRNLCRPKNQQIEEDTIRNIYAKMELPSEGILLKYNVDDNNFEFLIEEIKRHSLEREDITRAIKSVRSNQFVQVGNNYWENLDIDLRKCVRDLIREHGTNVGGLLAEAKKDLLAEMRANEKNTFSFEDLKDALWNKVQSKKSLSFQE